jgi:glycosyltransferase involved in cell wall biosynthesis
MHAAIVGTYPPTRCGIATFTADVESSLHHNGATTTIVPVEPGGPCIDRDSRDSYVRAARHLNDLGCDVVVIEHEFGIFGGVAGSHILALAAHLTVPYVVTLHTVLPKYSDDQLHVVQQLCRRAAAVTVFTDTARRLVLEQELVRASAVHVVAHGAPPELFARVDESAARRRLSLPPDVPVMSTFGLLSEGKGVEDAIEAMALLRNEHPDLHYVVAGRTHPEVVRHDGERYREALYALVQDLGLDARVTFLDRFLELDELGALLGISDVVCTPYHGEDQSVSGVLTFALAAGCPIASTPYRYARDVLAGGAGILVDFHDHEQLAEAIHKLLGPSGDSARDAARQASASLSWPTIGAELLVVLREAAQTNVDVPAEPSRPMLSPAASEPSTTYLRALCDGGAVLQHAHLREPSIDHGYCVDDAARMLPIIADLAVETGDGYWYATIARLLTFLDAAARDGRGNLRDFMSFDGRWLDEPYVGDHVGRAIWGLGETMTYDAPFAADAEVLLTNLVDHISSEWPARAIAYATLGLLAASRTEPRFADHLDRVVPTLRLWTPQDSPNWSWCESRLTYDNARLPEVLLRVGHRLGDEQLVHAGTTMLDWFEHLCLRDGHYRFPGYRGLDNRSQLPWSGDEQPIEASAMADAQLARLELSGDVRGAKGVERSWSWFLGNNRLAEPLIDLRTGASCDGLGERTINANCGAESTIAAHRCWRTFKAAQSLLATDEGMRPPASV